MSSYRKRNLIPFYTLGFFFLIVFIYLAITDQYRIFYLEQIQLFRYNQDYFHEFFEAAGGFSEYLGSFLTQFFLIKGVGAAIITLLLVVLYHTSLLILKNFRIRGILWPLLPVMLILALHGDHLYKPSNTVSLIISLAYTLFCLRFHKPVLRGILGFAGFFIFYNLLGVPAFLIPVLLSLYDLSFIRNNSRFYLSIVYLTVLILVPYFSWRFFYFLPLKESLLSPLPKFGRMESRIILISLLCFFPVFLTLSRFYLLTNRKSESDPIWNSKNWSGGIIVICLFSALIWKNTDQKMEQILGIDYLVQQEEWDQALHQCRIFPEPNNVVTYFTNLSLLKSGRIGDQMFNYNQLGITGLSIPWKNNNVVPFLGFDIYYQIGYINEAYRWAFEALETNGQCPRLLKRLVITSLINGDLELAEKYLNKLKQSFFYRKWANHYLELINHPHQIENDPEIKRKRTLLTEQDFFTGSCKTPLGLEKLLENHPDNKPAFEYYMAELLLSKDILSFISFLPRLKELDYKKIPVHYEEVILWYIGYSKQNVIPKGFVIRKSTLDRFKKYLYAYSGNNSKEKLAQTMKKEFGDTYWYYYHFNNL